MSERGSSAVEPTALPEPGGADLRELRRVLVVIASGSLGRTLLATSGLGALLEGLGDARVVCVGGPHAPEVLDGYGLEVRALGRADLLRPWRLLGRARRLRAERFDAWVQLGGSKGFPGALLARLAGVPHRLGVPAEGDGRLRLRSEELSDAEELLRTRLGTDLLRPVGLFVDCARRDEAWALSNFGAVARGVRARGLPLVVFVGGAEPGREQEIRQAIGEAFYVCGEDLRARAALAACCGAVLSADADSAQLAIAAGVATAALFRTPDFDRVGPRSFQGEVIYDPDGDGARRALEGLLRLYDTFADRKPELEDARAHPRRSRPFDR